MKKLTTDKDYVCISGKPSDITQNLNRIAALYELTVVSTDMRDGMVTVIVERRQKKPKSSTAAG